jgi:hypothetical protein
MWFPEAQEWVVFVWVWIRLAVCRFSSRGWSAWVLRRLGFGRGGELVKYVKCSLVVVLAFQRRGSLSKLVFCDSAPEIGVLKYFCPLGSVMRGWEPYGDAVVGALRVQSVLR